MTSFTPGPWSWGDGWGEWTNDERIGMQSDQKYLDLRLYGADGSEILPLRIDHYSIEVDGSHGTFLSQADRTLIAAAPDLLSALKALMDGEGEVHERVIAARAAISRAEGK